MKKKHAAVTEFAIGVKSQLDEVCLTRLLFSTLPKRRWRNYHLEFFQDVEEEFNWSIASQAKTDDVSEEDAKDLFHSIKRILTAQAIPVDTDPFK